MDETEDETTVPRLHRTGCHANAAWTISGGPRFTDSRAVVLVVCGRYGYLRFLRKRSLSVVVFGLDAFVAIKCPNDQWLTVIVDAGDGWHPAAEPGSVMVMNWLVGILGSRLDGAREL